MTVNFNTNCSSLLGNNSDTVDEQENKYILYNDCISQLEKTQLKLQKINKDKIHRNMKGEKKYQKKKKILNTYKNKKLTYDEELINNKKTINFLVIENRITLGGIILLIFLIYKYILK
jgi:hypothetical protein